MSGKQQKRLRREIGVSTDTKRDNNAFQRTVERVLDARAVRRERRRRLVRVGLAGVSLAVILAALIALVVL